MGRRRLTAGGHAGLSGHERQHSPAETTHQNELRPNSVRHSECVLPWMARMRGAARFARALRGATEGCGGENQRMHNVRLRVGAAERLVLRLQFFDVGEQLLFVRQTAHVETEHFVRAQGCFSTRPQRDQQARDDRNVSLYLDSVLTMA